LEQTENWLYEEGEDEKKQVYCDKLAELKKIGDPIVRRWVATAGVSDEAVGHFVNKKWLAGRNHTCTYFYCLMKCYI